MWEHKFFFFSFSIIAIAIINEMFTLFSIQSIESIIIGWFVCSILDSFASRCLTIVCVCLCVCMSVFGYFWTIGLISALFPKDLDRSINKLINYPSSLLSSLSLPLWLYQSLTFFIDGIFFSCQQNNQNNFLLLFHPLSILPSLSLPLSLWFRLVLVFVPFMFVFFFALIVWLAVE